MGSINCCSNNSVCYESKILDHNLDNTNSLHQSNTLNQTDQKQTTLMKKPSFFFHNSNFINMKSKSLFDEYEIKEKLGEGAYGCVYKAQHKKTRLIRAVKAIKQKHVETNLISNEVAILKTLDHPNVIRLYECYYDSNFYYMVEEYCSGGDLYDYIKRQKNFSEKKAASIIKQLLSAINHLHSRKIVHRDLKPENIVFIETKTNEIFIKLIDFGTSVFFRNEPLTQELGTIYYIAPEVFRNNYNEKADIWSCGIILYTMLCGHPPFRGNREEEIKAKILRGKLDFIGKEWAKVSSGAISMVHELLLYDASKRPTAEEALNNPWLINILKSPHENVLDNNIIQNMVKFTSSITLQRAALSFIANQIGQNEEMKIIKDEFDKIDANKDGVISKEELILCLSKIYERNEAIIKANEIFSEIDFNNDGCINFSEFVTVTMKKERLCSEEMLKKAFYMFDLDGNGYITVEELQETIPLNITSPDAWADIVREIDTDGDGQVSFGEFRSMMNMLVKAQE